MAKKIIFIFLLLFSISFAMSAPPQQNTDGFIIRSGIQEYLKQGVLYDAHVHVFNEVDGLPITENIECYFHIYNITGNHILTAMDNTSSNTFDYSVDIPASSLDKTGVYQIIIQCNGTVGPDEKGGFFSQEIYVNPSGTRQDYAHSKVKIFIISLFGAFGIFMFFVAGKLPQGNMRNDEGRLLTVSHLKYLRFPMWAIGYFSFIAVMFLSGSTANAYFGDGIGQMLYFIAYLMMFAIIPMMYVFIMKIIEDVWYDKELRRNIKMGFEEDGFKD